jgi:hypothetical protein
LGGGKFGKDVENGVTAPSQRRSDHRGRTTLRRPTMTNDQITEILKRPLSQEMLARDLCRQ